ncbi:MAG: outer membrane protein [Akkermansia muciniphila]
MKKTLAIIALAAPALAGTKPAVAPAPAPAPTPAPVVSPWAVELGAGFNKAAKVTFPTDEDFGQDQKKVNTWSWDITGVYNLDENNALTLRLGYAYGNRQQDVADRIITNTWCLMPGYRYTYALDDQWSIFAGVNAGIASHAWRVKIGADDGDDEPGTFDADDDDDNVPSSIHKSGWGFAYSAELGVRYAINTNWDVFAAYQFSGNTAAPKYKISGPGGTFSLRSKKQNFHGVRIGVGYTF